MDKKGFKNLKRILKGEDPKKNIQTGYTGHQKTGPSSIGRSPGDVWEEDGKKWKMTENGTIQSVSRMDRFRIPLTCPNCSKTMKGKKDNKAYFINETCINCLVDYHEDLRKVGKLKQFSIRKQLLNARSWVEEQKGQYEEFANIASENPEYIQSDGSVENWSNSLDTEELIEEYEEFIEEFESNLLEEISNYENKYDETLEEWTDPLNDKQNKKEDD